MADPSDTIIPLYEKHALAFDGDRRASRWLERGWHERFIALLPAKADALDLGCGGGVPVAEHLIANGCRVTGVDSSQSLIGLCRTRFPEHQWFCADMRRLDLGRRFHGILAWDSFFHLSHADQRGMFAVFAAHASPGAVLIFNTGPAHAVAISSYRGDPLYHASLGAEEYRQLLAAHGFGVIDHKPEDPSAGGRTVWLAQLASSEARALG
jgi:SAM-dependent methyltransferase